MKKEIEAKFDAIFSAREKRVQDAQSAEVDRKTQESEFRDRFIKHRADVIKPAMEQTADYLRSRGVVTTRITESDESINDRERPQTLITFTVMEDGETRFQPRQTILIVYLRQAQKDRLDA